MSAHLTTVPGTPREAEPTDGYGAGFLAYQIRTSFRDLCRVIGKEAARQEIAEIVNDEFERKNS